MPDISDVLRRSVFTGSVGTGPYSCNWEILAQTDIEITFNDAVLTLTTDYTVSINGDGTFAVTLVVGSAIAETPDADDTVAIYGAKPIARTSDFQTGGDFFADTINDELAAIVIFCQQLHEADQRTLKGNTSDDTDLDMSLPTAEDRASKYLAFDAEGAPVATAGTTSEAVITPFAETVLDDTTAADMRTTLGVPSNAEAILDTIMDAAGDTIEATAADTPARKPAAATVAAHATTMDPWGARVVTLSGGAVTFTDLADADYVGQRVLLLMNAAHIWTDGAVFDVQGGATYTCAAGDWVELVATAVDAFDVTIIPANGQAAATTTGSTASTFTFNGSGGSTGSLTLSWQKTGNWVTLNIPVAQATSGTNSSTLTSNTALAAGVRPTANQVGAVNSIYNNGAGIDAAGQITVTTAGIVVFNRDAAGTVFTDASVCGTQTGVSITYFIG